MKTYEDQEPAAVVQARKEGYEAGVGAASWILDGRSDDSDALRLLVGLRNGDPEIMDRLPAAPLSGEWAGGTTCEDVFDLVEIDEDDPISQDVLAAYEDGFSSGATDGAEKLALAHLGLTMPDPPTTVHVLTFESMPGVRETARVFTDGAQAMKALEAMPTGVAALLQQAPLDPQVRAAIPGFPGNLGAAQPYAWPGGYPIAYVCDDGDNLCAKCVNDETNPVHVGGDADGWKIEGIQVLEGSPEDYGCTSPDGMRCAHCDVVILGPTA